MLLRRQWRSSWVFYLIPFVAVLCFILRLAFSSAGAGFEPPQLGQHGTNDHSAEPDPATPDKSAENVRPESLHHSTKFGTWLKSRGITSDVTPIVTIADSKYLRVLHSLRSRLETWGYGLHLVVLCLDAACVHDEALHGYAGFMQDGGQVMHSVALLKVLTPSALTSSV